jgi:hypothetical protein
LNYRSRRNKLLFDDQRERARARNSFYLQGERVKGGFRFVEILQDLSYKYIIISLDGEVVSEETRDHGLSDSAFVPGRKLRKTVPVRHIINPWRVNRYFNESCSKDEDDFNFANNAERRQIFHSEYDIRTVEVYRINLWKLMISHHDAQYFNDYIHLTDRENISIIESDYSRSNRFLSAQDILQDTIERYMKIDIKDRKERISINYDTVVATILRMQEGFLIG